MIRRTLSLLAVTAAASLLCVSCANPPTSTQEATAKTVGAGAKIALDLAAPQFSPVVAPFAATFAAAIRSISDVAAPSPAAVTATLTLWAAALPISQAEKDHAIAAVSAQYERLYPQLVATKNAAPLVEDFLSGFYA